MTGRFSSDLGPGPIVVAITCLPFQIQDILYFTFLTSSLFSMTSEKARFAQEVAQVEQWWKVISIGHN